MSQCTAQVLQSDEDRSVPDGVLVIQRLISLVWSLQDEALEALRVLGQSQQEPPYEWSIAAGELSVQL